MIAPIANHINVTEKDEYINMVNFIFCFIFTLFIFIGVMKQYVFVERHVLDKQT